MKVKSKSEWTAYDAYCQYYGKDRPLPSANDVSKEQICDIDHEVADILGVSGEEWLKKIHAAIIFLMPVLTENPLPPADLPKDSGYGPAAVAHVSKTVIRVAKEYAPDVGVKLSELRGLIKALERFDLSAIDDWFYVWDALGSTGAIKDKELNDFYTLAGLMWRFEALKNAPTHGS